MRFNTMNHFSPDLTRLGPRLHALRSAQHLSVSEIALAAGIDASHYYAIERGRQLPSLPLLDQLAGVLRVDLADFFPRRR